MIVPAHWGPARVPGSRADVRMVNCGGWLSNGARPWLGRSHGWRKGHPGCGAVPGVASVSGRRDRGAPEQHLRQVISALAGPGKVSAAAGRDDEPLGRALVFRPWPARSLHIVGDSPLATEFRRLLTAGTVHGWELHPVPAGRTPLHVLAGPLHRLSGSYRFYNLLERNGFAFVEEVAAMPEECWFELRNCGTRFIAAVRPAIAGLPPGDTQTTTGILPGSDGAVSAGSAPVTPAGLPADAARALQVIAAWAVAEHAAPTLGDLLGLAPGVPDLPPDVARNWDRIRQLDLRPLAGAALADGDLPRLAFDLLDELEERRRLILTSRTFAPGPAHLRQPGRRARRRPRARPPARDLGAAAAGPRGRARPVPPATLAGGIGRTTWGRLRRRGPRRAAVAGPDAVLAGRPARLTPGVVHPPPSAHPASSALSMRARAFRTSWSR